MIEHLRTRLHEVLLKKERLEKVELMLKELEEEMSLLVKQAKALKVKLDQEQIDVDRLVKLTPTHLFYALTGKQEEKLNKEQQEVYIAQMKLRNQLLQVEECQTRIKNLHEERDELLKAEDEYNKLSEEIKAYLKDDEEIGRLDRKIAQCKAQNIELEEAFHAGGKVIEDCDDILASLKSASDWGVYDMLAGSTFSTAIKHSHLDKAQIKLEKLQTSLRDFKTELVDLKFMEKLDKDNFDFRLGSFLNIADYVFDNIFVDWSVQDKVKDFKKQITELKNRIEKISIQLRKLHRLNLENIQISEDRLQERIRNI